jgi:hypothetical protein
MVPALQAALEALLAELAADAEAEDGAGAGPWSGAAYAMQLTLALLRALVTGAGAAAAAPLPPPSVGRRGRPPAPRPPPASPFDLALVVRCAQAAPDAGARNAALALVEPLAAADPRGALAHALGVLGALGAGPALDAHSEAVAAAALGAVGRAWAAAGGPLAGLADAAAEAVLAMPARRRLPLLAALLRALPPSEGLAALVAALLKLQAGAEAGADGPPELADALARQVRGFWVSPFWGCCLGACGAGALEAGRRGRHPLHVRLTRKRGDEPFIRALTGSPDGGAPPPPAST